MGRIRKGNHSTAGILLILASIGLVLSGCEESYDSKFADYREARERGHVAKGWIPDCLPDKAHSFLERHDLDTNEVWLFFRFTPWEHDALRAVLKERRGDEWRFFVRRSPPPFWWPKSLPRRVKFYTFATQPPCRPYYQAAYVAVDWEAGYAYFKSP